MKTSYSHTEVERRPQLSSLTLGLGSESGVAEEEGLFPWGS
jgi:hypothetical protein